MKAAIDVPLRVRGGVRGDLSPTGTPALTARDSARDAGYRRIAECFRLACTSGSLPTVDGCADQRSELRQRNAFRFLNHEADADLAVRVSKSA
jgi:hypothetical protein